MNPNSGRGFLDTLVSRRGVAAIAAGVAVAGLVGCSDRAPNVAESTPPAHEAMTDNEKEALRLMFEQGAQVIEQGMVILKPAENDRLVLDMSSGSTSHFGVVEYVRRSADPNPKTATDLVGSDLVVQYDTKKDEITISVTTFTANGKEGDYRPVDQHYATWLVKDRALKSRIIDGLETCGDLVGRIKKSIDSYDMDTKDSTTSDMELTAVSVNAANVPEDAIAGYVGSQEYINRDETGLSSIVWTFEKDGKTLNMQTASALTQPNEFNGLITKFGIHAPYAQKAISAGVGKR